MFSAELDLNLRFKSSNFFPLLSVYDTQEYASPSPHFVHFCLCVSVRGADCEVE